MAGHGGKAMIWLGCKAAVMLAVVGIVLSSIVADALAPRIGGRDYSKLQDALEQFWRRNGR
ncbi:MAG: hypothetical protein IPQ07_40010 [Myxococcales bacterium]|nr:hypothetical protein [Myxococcales bacterium]